MNRHIAAVAFVAVGATLVTTSTVLAEGTISGPKNIVYVFVDANCPFCHYTWLALQPYEKVGLQVRWIPVATLGPTSMPKAIEIMAAADQVAAFRKMEENHGKPWTPSALSNEAAQPAVAAAIRKNGNSSLDKFR